MPCVAGRIRIGMSKDNVNHPSHYEAGPFECIELTRLYPFAGGNAIKYVFRHRAKNGVEDLEKALWYLDHATVDELRPMPCASNSKACHLLRVLERADWQVMAPFWKGMWELAQGYDSGLTRAHRAVDRRVRLLENPLTDDELKLLDGWSAKPEAAWRLRAGVRLLHRDRRWPTLGLHCTPCQPMQSRTTATGATPMRQSAGDGKRLRQALA